MTTAQFCDQCPVPPYNSAENEWRAERMSMMIAKIGDDDDTIHARGGLALEYVWLTNPQTYNLGYPKGYDLADDQTRTWIAEYLRRYVDGNNLDGLMLDCPLDYLDKRAALDMVHALKYAMPGKIIMPNFGSYDAWELTGHMGSLSRFAAFTELRSTTDWHFVQVALHTRDGWEKRFHACVATLNQMIAAGKHVVVGIDDRLANSEGPHRPDLAAALAYRLPRHPNVYVYYQCAAHPPQGTHVKDYGWCETLEALL